MGRNGDCGKCSDSVRMFQLRRSIYFLCHQIKVFYEILEFLGQHRFITSLCEGLVSSVLDSTKELTTIHANNKKRLLSVNTSYLYIMFMCSLCPVSKIYNDTNRNRREIDLSGSKLILA